MATKRVPEVIFSATAYNERLVFDNTEDLRKYLVEHAGEKLFVHIEPEAQIAPKMKQYAFYHKVILHCAVLGYTNAGYEGIDNVNADYLLRASFCKDFIKNPNGEYIPIMLDKRNMTKTRLHKFMEDCIFFIENDLQVIVPDSDTYKLNKVSGRNFKKIERD